MTSQLPTEAQGAAAGVLIYSFAALICSCLTVWLVWTYQERTSHIAFLSYLLVVSTASEIASEIHDFIHWRDVMVAQWKATISSPRDPELVISNGAVGLDLWMWYLRQYCFSAAAMIAMFWAFTLLQHVYGWSYKVQLKPGFERINKTGKILSIMLPILAICLLQVKAIRASLIGFMILANVLLMISLAGGITFMGLILFRYIQSRRQIVTWSLRYGQDPNTSSDRKTNAFPTIPANERVRKRAHGIYDRWLMTRFSIAFLVLSILEVSNMLVQFTGLENNSDDSTRSEPDLSIERAKETAVLFLPGPVPSFLLFIVFGTTAPFRKHMYNAFVPKAWQKQRAPKYQPRKSTFSQKDPRSTVSDLSPRSPPTMPTPAHFRQDIQMMDLEAGANRAHGSSSDDERPILPPWDRCIRVERTIKVTMHHQ